MRSRALRPLQWLFSLPVRIWLFSLLFPVSMMKPRTLYTPGAFLRLPNTLRTNLGRERPKSQEPLS